MRHAARLFLALVLILACTSLTSAADAAAAAPLDGASAAGGGVLALILAFVGAKLLPPVFQILTRKVDVEAKAIADAEAAQATREATRDEQAAKHVAFVQQLVGDFRADLAKTHADFLAALEAQRHEFATALESQRQELLERFAPRIESLRAPTQETVHAG